MTDQFDRASAQEQRERDAVISRRKKPAAGQAAEFCIDCDDLIPAARREAVPGAQRCASCQAEIEGAAK